ncbi:sensor histidine kinase [Candidatus Margulisiibacteriota bacterium]
MKDPAFEILYPDNQESNDDTSQKGIIIDILQIINDTQKRLRSVEDTIAKFNKNGNYKAVVSLIRKLAAEDKGILQQFIRYLRRYDQDNIYRFDQGLTASEKPVYNLENNEELQEEQSHGNLEDIIHDLRNGLSGLQAYIQMIEKGKLPGREKTIFSGIDKSAAYIEGLIDDLATSEQSSTCKIIDISNLIKRTVKLHGLSSTQPILQLESIKTIGNELQLMRVFTNLLENAYQALQSEKGTIIVQSFTEGNKAIIMFSDNGIGIHKENLSKVFLKHFTTKTDGKGIGLTISKSIIEEYGGSISVESEPKKGTTFIIQLPLTPGANGYLEAV